VESDGRFVLGCGYRYGTKEHMRKADFHEWIGASERLADLTVSSEGATRRKAKESVEYGHRIYSLELTEIKTARGLGNTPSGNEGERATPHGLPLAENDDNHLSQVSP